MLKGCCFFFYYFNLLNYLGLFERYACFRTNVRFGRLDSATFTLAYAKPGRFRGLGRGEGKGNHNYHAIFRQKYREQ